MNFHISLLHRLFLSSLFFISVWADINTDPTHLYIPTKAQSSKHTSSFSLDQILADNNLQDLEKNLTYEEKLMKEININPISLYGDSVTISHCPEKCNENGVCQRIFNIDQSKDILKEQATLTEIKFKPRHICAC